jgi:midasin
LVRINLSEQTDISDLMGNDLPHTSETNTDLSSHATFRWCDGVLLKAIKRGDWVLLDELNLASQSVLEGLNSCLDHRASVYIPELGKSFDCPPSFRIFAAQNPLAQGGGRKGLPKSFLNRFTKVYVEALTRNDLLNIVSDQFPSVPTTLVTNMVDTNCQVQHDIQTGLYGQHGSPWEFNLRDVFRWCRLLTADGAEVTPACAAKYANILYTQRLRTAQDRTLVKKQFNEYLGKAAIFNSPPRLTVSQTRVVVGTAAIERNLDEFAWSDIPTQDSGPDTAQSLYSPMEAVASCVRMNWPCLLVGPSSSGKNTILKTLADASNIQIETLAMSSSTDVTELIGCFEQTDSMKMSKKY